MMSEKWLVTFLHLRDSFVRMPGIDLFHFHCQFVTVCNRLSVNKHTDVPVSIPGRDYRHITCFLCCALLYLGIVYNCLLQGILFTSDKDPCCQGVLIALIGLCKSSPSFCIIESCHNGLYQTGKCIMELQKDVEHLSSPEIDYDIMLHKECTGSKTFLSSKNKLSKIEFR